MRQMRRICTDGNDRNYGVDLLRVVSMFYIVMIHNLGYGGVVAAAARGSAHHLVGRFLEMWVYSALDIFALISGYVGYREQEQKFHYSNYLILWLQVVVTGLATAGIFWIFAPGTVAPVEFLRALTPITSNTHWYFTAYTGLFFLMPLLNAGVRGSSREQLYKLVAVLVILFSVYSTLGDRWQLKSGFSCLWLITLYFIGAVAKKYRWESLISPKLAVAGIVVSACLSWGVRLLEDYRPFMDRSLVDNTYLTPTHLCGALCYLLLFAGMRIPDWMKKGIALAAPGTFAVYLLNCNRLIWNRFVVSQFAGLAAEPLPVMLLGVVGGAVVFVLLAVLADMLRQQLFRLLRIKKRVRCLADRLALGKEK